MPSPDAVEPLRRACADPSGAHSVADKERTLSSRDSFPPPFPPSGTGRSPVIRSTPTAAISIRGLVKHYGEFVAVDGLDLDIRRGEIFALLGPNGAGKTTTVEICEGYRKPRRR